tara:strand:- start:1420 stop:2334 length:915 start_codon:yes stop_codon:yes gene_type:complete
MDPDNSSERPHDFAEFWNRTIDESSRFGLDASLIEDPLRSNDEAVVYKVALNSLGRIIVGGWYAVPRETGVFPALMLLPAYSNHPNMGVRTWAEQGIACLWLSIRGHSFGDSITPGFPGYLCYNVWDRESYIYRGAFCDAVNGVKFLLEREEVDTGKIVVSGSSQGGALTLVTSALMSGRILGAAADVPFLTNIQESVRLSSSYPYNEIPDFIRKYPEREQAIWETLRYFDVDNFAKDIQCPVLMAVGMKDDICPTPPILSMADKISGSLDIRQYENAAHEAGTAYLHTVQKVRWIKEMFGMSA